MKLKCKTAFKAIGYTNDREQVFMTQDALGDEGQPMELTFMWTPKDAANVAKMLMQAADACVTKSPIILPGRGG